MSLSSWHTYDTAVLVPFSMSSNMGLLHLQQPRKALISCRCVRAGSYLSLTTCRYGCHGQRRPATGSLPGMRTRLSLRRRYVLPVHLLQQLVTQQRS